MQQLSRETEFVAWLDHVLGKNSYHIEPLAGDASFRKYSRIRQADITYMAMDAPPAVEDCAPFVAVTKMLYGHGVKVPKIINQALAQGFLLLEDFGDTLLSTQLNQSTVDGLYSAAMRQLLALQHAPELAGNPLPHYDVTRLTNEMQLFDMWFIPQYLNRSLTADEHAMLTQSYAFIANACATQPAVVVHRDYHCRNLMVLENTTSLGIIDYQDAVIGPVTYDLVSLLRDAYVVWPIQQVAGWVEQFLLMQQEAGFLTGVDITQFLQWFNLMGAQRHLKVLGIFVRLCKRDGKTAYLKDLPLVLWYLLLDTQQVPELLPLNTWLRTHILPAFIAQVPHAAHVLQGAVE